MIGWFYSHWRRNSPTNSVDELMQNKYMFIPGKYSSKREIGTELEAIPFQTDANWSCPKANTLGDFSRALDAAWILLHS